MVGDGVEWRRRGHARLQRVGFRKKPGESPASGSAEVLGANGTPVLSAHCAAPGECRRGAEGGSRCESQGTSAQRGLQPAEEDVSARRPQVFSPGSVSAVDNSGANTADGKIDLGK